MSRAPTIEVNGYAGRRIRDLLRFDVPDVAAKMGVSANYLYRIENGTKPRISTKAFKAWADALLTTDPRELLASPHTQEWPNGNGHEDAA